MHFQAEQFSGFFRRSLQAMCARGPQDEPSIRLALQSQVSHAVDQAALEALLARFVPPELMQTPVQAGEAVATGLRQFRQWVILSLMERDLRGDADLQEVCRAMSTMARLTTECAMRVAGAELKARHGTALDTAGQPQDLLAVAMGKGGADELNVSSDLDLVFVFRDAGQTDGAASPDERALGGIISAGEWMHKTAQRTVDLLARITADGFVFRVDTRLRPNGDSGPLVAAFPMLEQYFYSQGREWERFAWLKGRVIADSGCAGDVARREDDRQLERIVTPFVFRRYLDYEAFAALRDLHARIRGEVGKRSIRKPEAIDVKLGRGGIREIEFTAQLFQIVRGGRDPGLRSPRTLDNLNALAERGVLERTEADRLTHAYTLLRRTEHALQYREDAQTHSLPAAAEERAHIAGMLRMSAPEFNAAIDEATADVSAVFDKLLAPAGDQTTRPDQAADAAESASTPVDPDVQRRIDVLRAGARYAAAKQETRAAVDRLITDALSRRTGPAGMVRLTDLLESVCRRPAYVALLSQYPHAFGRVLRILDWAKWPADYLMRHPIVLDELLDGELLSSTDYLQWAAQLRERVVAARIGDAPDVELQMDLLREAHHAQVFRLMVQDLQGLHSTERISDFLSELADQVLKIVIELAWSQLKQAFRPQPRFAAIAYGRLGGKELGYASDLDLVFLHEDDDPRAAEVYSLLAQRLSGWLSTRTAAGLLFETDLRLRPNGQAGLLVSSVEAFERYQRESAWVWEHQALTRARFAAGDREVGEHFERVRRSLLAQSRDLSALKQEVRAMRQKMHDGHPNRSELFDLKHDRGGMVDVEFIVQTLVLAHSHAHAELLDNAGNIALLGRAAQAGLIASNQAQAAADAYRRYRQLQHTLRLNDAQYARVPRETVSADIAMVSALWEAVLGE
jgi:glutamate-ammonia-ligase adenylyltransferase